MQSLAGGVGGMLAVALSVERVRELLAADAGLQRGGCGWHQCAAADGGVWRQGAAGVLKQQLEAEGVKATELKVSHAFHSRQMAPVVEQFRAAASEVSFSVPRIAMVSSVTGEVLRAVDAGYWCRQIVEAVDFVSAIGRVGSEIGPRLYLEVGPSPVLTGLGQQCVAGSGSGAASGGPAAWAYSLRAGVAERPTLLRALGACYVSGVSVEWAKHYGGGSGDSTGSQAGYRKISVPTYAFQRQRYWVEGLESQSNSLAGVLWQA